MLARSNDEIYKKNRLKKVKEKPANLEE